MLTRLAIWKTVDFDPTNEIDGVQLSGTTSPQSGGLAWEVQVWRACSGGHGGKTARFLRRGDGVSIADVVESRAIVGSITRAETGRIGGKVLFFMFHICGLFLTVLTGYLASRIARAMSYNLIFKIFLCNSMQEHP